MSFTLLKMRINLPIMARFFPITASGLVVGPRITHSLASPLLTRNLIGPRSYSFPLEIASIGSQLQLGIFKDFFVLFSCVCVGLKGDSIRVCIFEGDLIRVG